MKSFRIAIIALILLIVSVFANSAYIKNTSEQFIAGIELINETDPDAARLELNALYKKFKKAEKIISITTSHDDLTSIEEEFSEMIGAVNAKEMSEVVKIKSRLKSSFEHLRRLSGINIDSII